MRDLDAADLARRLTLADLLLRPIGIGALRTVVLTLAVLGLVLPSFARRRELWLALALLAAWRVVTSWPLADNHAYLLGYWCLALAIASLDADPRPALAWSGRVLIGLVFALAVLSKATSPDYLDGRFFRVTLVADERLAPFARVAGGLSEEELHEQRVRLTEHVDGEAATSATAWSEPPRFRAVVAAATFGGFAWEALVALAFLWPLGRGLSRVRDPLLMGFCATTYLMAPVAGFGWLLIALGVAQTEAERGRTRAAYLAVFGLVFLYREIPWSGIGLG